MLQKQSKDHTEIIGVEHSVQERRVVENIVGNQIKSFCSNFKTVKEINYTNIGASSERELLLSEDKSDLSNNLWRSVILKLYTALLILFLLELRQNTPHYPKDSL